MIRIEKISNNISEKISSQLNLDQDKKEIINYGAFSLIQMLISIILVVLFGMLFRVPFEATLISFIIAILRKYSGGVHATTPTGCNIIGTFICIVLAIIFNYIYLWLNIKGVIAVSVVIYAWAYYIVFKLAPVDNQSKPIKKEAKRQRLKKTSIFILCIYLAFNMVSIATYLGNSKDRFLIYSLCICGGIVWQVFTLTKAGHFIINKVDAFLNQIFKLKGE